MTIENTKKRPTLSENIMRYLMTQGLTQTQVGKLLGLTRSFCSYVAKGQRNFTADEMERLAEALDMTLPELLARSTPPETVPARLRKNYRLLLRGLKASVDLRRHLPPSSRGTRKRSATA